MIWESEIRLQVVCFLCKTLPKRLKLNEVDIYMFKVKKKGTRTRSEIYPELTNMATRQRQFSRSGAFIVNFENILHLALVFLF